MTTALDSFHPLIAQWFADTYGQATQIQASAWPPIAAGEHVLLTAPTGSGKTLAACLWALNQLLTGAWSAGCVRVVYISPLKALGTDVRRNLQEPLHQLTQLLQNAGQADAAVQIATRSGDTSPGERARQARHPPEILVTTPESLNLLLASQTWKDAFAGVHSIILDEIHAVADSKRGTWTMQAVEALAERAEQDPQRIALSATIRPLDTIAAFVGGYRGDQHRGYQARAMHIVDTGERRLPSWTIAPIVSVEEEERSEDPDSFWRRTVPAIRASIGEARSTLIFCNSRMMAEKLTRFVNEGQPTRLAYAHHGSLSRELRDSIESRLKRGEIPAVVCTGTLELGIDIGDCEQVLLIQAPPSIASTLQRLGRAGHRVGADIRGRLFPTHGMDLIEAAVLHEAVQAGRVEGIHPVRAPLDVLAQIIIARCLIEPQEPQALLDSLHRQWAYRSLSERAFELVCDSCCGRHRGGPLRDVKALLEQDPASGLLKARDAARYVFFTNAGVIPDRGYFQMRTQQDGTLLGELDEEFVWERSLGDRFTFGSRHWRITAISNDVVEVVATDRADVMAPFWKNESRDRQWSTAEAIGRFLQELDPKDKNLPQALQQQHGLDEEAAIQLVDYIKLQADATEVLPHRSRLVVEHSREIGGSTNLIILHAHWGRCILRPLAIALPIAWRRRHGSEIGCEASNHALLIQLPHAIDSQELLDLVAVDSIDALVQEGLESSGFFGARFRENAGRALLLTRRHRNKRTPLWLTRQRAKELLSRVKRLPDFPLVAETWRSCLEDHFDLAGLKDRLQELQDGSIAIHSVHTSRPSPFIGDLVFKRINRLMYLDDQPLDAERGTMSGDTLAAVLRDPSLQTPLPPEALEALLLRLQRSAGGWEPQSRADLLDHVDKRILVPQDQLRHWLQLLQENDADCVPELQQQLLGLAWAGSARWWVVSIANIPRLLLATGHAPETIQLRQLDDSTPSPQIRQAATDIPSSLHDSFPSADDALRQCLHDVLTGWGPCRSAEIAEWFSLPETRVLPLLHQLADHCECVSGPLVAGSAELHWCESINYERGLRLARQLRRPPIEPRSATSLPAFLASWQGWFNDDISMQQAWDPLLGFPAPAALWEQALLPCRMPQYRSHYSDEVVGDGPLLWFGCGKERIAHCFHEAQFLYRLPPSGPADPLPAIAGPQEVGNQLRHEHSNLLSHHALPADKLVPALWQAAWNGRISNSSYAFLRQAIASRFTPPAKRDAARRLRSRFGSWDSSHNSGSWFRLPAASTNDDLLEQLDQDRERIRQLLRRYGIICRELLKHELPALRWAQLLPSLRLMELSGELLSAPFLQGVTGLQFASPEALRAWQNQKVPAQAWICHAQDPVSGCGLGLAGLTAWPARRSGNWLIFFADQLIITVQRNGQHLTIDETVDRELLPDCIGCLQIFVNRQVAPMKKVVVQQINDAPARQSPYADVFMQCGGEKHPDGFVFRKQYSS